MAAVFCLLRGEIAEISARKLREKRLLCKASRSYLVSIVKKKLKGVGCKRNVSEPEYVRFDGYDIVRLLAGHRSSVTKTAEGWRRVYGYKDLDTEDWTPSDK